MVDCTGYSKGKIQVVICCRLNCAPYPPKYVEWSPISPVPVSVTLFGNKIFVDVIKLRWSHNPVWPSPCKKRSDAEADLHRERKCEEAQGMLCDDRWRDWSAAPTSRWTPRIASNAGSKEKGKEQILPGAFRDNMALPTPWFRTSSLQNWENKFLLF